MTEPQIRSGMAVERFAAILAVATLLGAGPAMAQDVQGFVELRASALIGVDGEPFQVVERFRPTFEAELGERFKASTTVEFALSQGRNIQEEMQRTVEESDFAPLFEFANCAWPTDENERLHISSVDDYLSVDRLYVDGYSPRVDVRVGRQALQWGSAQFINPTDPFPEVLFTEPWKPRTGVNAIRGTFAIGERHQLQGVVGTDDLFQRVRLATRGTVNALETDFSLVSAYRQEGEELLTGIDIRGTVGVGFWIEGAVHARGLLGTAIEDALWEELVVGIDYSLPILELAVFSLQYYRSGAPAGGGPTGFGSGIEAPTCLLPDDFDGQSDIDAFFADPADTDPFAPTFTGENYGMLTTALVFTRDVSTNAAWLQNLDDGTAMIVPSLSVTPVGALEVSLSAQIPTKTWGKGGEFSTAPRDLVVELPEGSGLEIHFNGLVPKASVFLWTRVSF